MITESFQEYKGYTIKLRAATGNGFWYKIIKTYPNSSSPNGIKNLLLREKGWNFIEPNILLQKAKNYIDNYSKELEEKYDRLKLKCK
jgi:hypothetical protein